MTRDALTLAERVMGAMRTPVLAFAADGTLRLLNPAAESAFSVQRDGALAAPPKHLGLSRCSSCPMTRSTRIRQSPGLPVKPAGRCVDRPSGSAGYRTSSLCFLM